MQASLTDNAYDGRTTGHTDGAYDGTSGYPRGRRTNMTPSHAPVLPDPEGQVRSTSAESEAPVAARHPIIYNLFPNLAGQAPRSAAHAERARRIGVGWTAVYSAH